MIESLNSTSVSSDCPYYEHEGKYYYPLTAKPYGNNYKFANGTAIESGTKYWFNVEPIKWRVLGDDFVTTTMLIDAHRFNYGGGVVPMDATDYEGNTGKAYSSNYKFSEIRTWLNTTFYDMAFCFQSSRIKKAEVDNSKAQAESPCDDYVCENTFDKVFLLSRSECNYLMKDRACCPTDFALARGAFSDGMYGGADHYYTRSPNMNGADVVGKVYSNNYLGYAGCGDDSYGVRPGLKVTLE